MSTWYYYLILLTTALILRQTLETTTNTTHIAVCLKYAFLLPQPSGVGGTSAGPTCLTKATFAMP